MKKIIIILAFLMLLSGLSFAGAFSYESPATVVFSSATTGAGNTSTLADCTATRVEGKIGRLAVTFKTNYSGSGGSDTVVGCYTSPDNSSWDTVEIASFTVTCIAGAEVQQTEFFTSDALWYKFKVSNADSVHVTTNTTITIMEKN